MKPVLKRTITALTTATIAVLAIIHVPASLFPYAFAVLFLLVGVESYQLVARRRPPFSVGGLVVMIPVLTVVGVAFSVLPRLAAVYGNLMMLYVIAIVKVSDMGGFALGVAFGRHKLCPTVSPNKSWEGLAGSVLASVILSCLFMPATHFVWAKAVGFGVAAAILGTAGDLMESKFKRWAGVKDSATFMPAGLGGFLDMFDSLLVAPAALMPFI